MDGSLILVTGATGTVGNEVVRLLVETGHRVVGDGKDSFVDPCDVAAVAVHVLTGTGDDGATTSSPDPSGSATPTRPDRLGKAIGAPVKLVDVPRDAARADLLTAGLPSSQADALLMLFDGIRAGRSIRQRKPSLTY